MTKEEREITRIPNLEIPINPNEEYTKRHNLRINIGKEEIISG